MNHHFVLLSGGTGFVGQPLRELFSLNQTPVRLILRKEVPLYSNEEAFYTQDLFKENVLFFQKALKNIHTVIHLAWYTEHGKYQHSPLNEICAKTSYLFAQTALKETIRHFIGVGTCFEYAIQNKKMDIATPLIPSTPYGKAKANLYLKLNALFHNTATRFSWARLFYLFGENENPKRLTPYIYNCLKNKEKIQIHYLNAVRDFLNTQEVAQKLLSLALSHPSQNSAYNICSGKGISIQKYIQNIAKKSFNIKQIEFAPPPAK